MSKFEYVAAMNTQQFNEYVADRKRKADKKGVPLDVEHVFIAHPHSLRGRVPGFIRVLNNFQENTQYYIIMEEIIIAMNNWALQEELLTEDDHLHDDIADDVEYGNIE